MTDAKDVITKRIAEIEMAIQNSLTNHSALVGHLDEAKFLLQTIFKAECEANEAQAPVVADAEVGKQE